jgi:hypothetical protein
MAKTGSDGWDAGGNFQNCDVDRYLAVKTKFPFVTGYSPICNELQLIIQIIIPNIFYTYILIKQRNTSAHTYSSNTMNL